jgi:uncharacterized damage-inducible protein DinB
MKNNSSIIFDYNAWANSIVLNHIKTLPERVFRQQVKSVFSSIFETVTHTYIIDRGWYSILSKEYASDDYEAIGQSVKKLIDECKDDSPDDMLSKMEALNRKFRCFIQDNAMEHVETFSGVSMSYGDVIIHIVNHGTYHRGNVTAMLRQLGFKGTATDYGFYLHYMQLGREPK